MPIYKSYNPNSSTCIKVWKISESFNELFSSVDVNRPYKKLLANKPNSISFKPSSIQRTIDDFYLTNTISRFSKTMAECSQVRKDLRAANKL